MAKFPVHRDPRSSSGGGSTTYEASIMMDQGIVRFDFSTPHRGPRQSCFVLVVQPDNFRVLAEAMMRANHEAAIKAFGAALEAGIPQKKEVWRPKH